MPPFQYNPLQASTPPGARPYKRRGVIDEYKRRGDPSCVRKDIFNMRPPRFRAFAVRTSGCASARSAGGGEDAQRGIPREGRAAWEASFYFPLPAFLL